ncbi:hypothetical protein N0V90_013268 [Kalmusia sp. IMI 367209]|nr:hypothetical protein N0V90_013268 [Kalmusia sp. IMI 367209]
MEETSEFRTDVDEYEQELAAPPISLELLPSGADSSAYRTRNDPSQPYQRAKITERGGAVGAECRMVDVVHGRLGSLEGYEEFEDAKATLIILDFAFDSRKNTRRIESAKTTFHFQATGGGDDDPAVVRIDPDGRFELVETSHTVDTTTNLGLDIGAPPIAGFQAGAQVGWEQSTSRVKQDSTRLVGWKHQIDRDYGEDNAASWTLLENSTEKTGVPTSMRACILLKRENDLPFQCIFSLKLEVDLKSSLEKTMGMVFGKKLIDDPILFDPSRKPTKRQLEIFDINSLSSPSLAARSRVISKNVLDGTIHHVGQN